jgi:hypothetical protein
MIDISPFSGIQMDMPSVWMLRIECFAYAFVVGRMTTHTRKRAMILRANEREIATTQASVDEAIIHYRSDELFSGM